MSRLLNVPAFFASLAFALWAVSGFAKAPSEIQAGIDRIQRQAFADLAQYAEQNGIQVYVGGSTVTRMAFLSNDHDVVESVALPDLVARGQDIDVAIEGSRGQLEKLSTWLQTHYPQYRWDAGLRRLVETDEFRLQNTDSLSTTFLRLSSKPGGSELVDFRRSDHSSRIFLEDVSSRRIRFLSSGYHRNTLRYVKKQNPEVFSVMRYFTNIAKFKVRPSPEDLRVVSQIVEDFDYSRDIDSDYALRRFQELAEKLRERRGALVELLGDEEGFVMFEKLTAKLHGTACSVSEALHALLPVAPRN